MLNATRVTRPEVPAVRRAAGRYTYIALRIAEQRTVDEIAARRFLTQWNAEIDATDEDGDL